MILSKSFLVAMPSWCLDGRGEGVIHHIRVDVVDSVGIVVEEVMVWKPWSWSPPWRWCLVAMAGARSLSASVRVHA